LTQNLLSLSTDDFIAGIDKVARLHFDCQTYPQQNLSPDDWALLVRAGVFLPALPREFGGRDSHVEMCRVVESISEWNLPVGMYTMIVTAIVLRSIALHAGEEARREMLSQFSGQEPMLAGFASTEPHCGSNMAAMATTFTETADGYRIRGQKHWQAFSNTAHWWLVAARSDDGSRRFGYFVVKRSEGFRTVQRYDSLGLRAIDYGHNEIDAVVPRHRRIAVEESNLSPMVEMLMPSRTMMAALACGFLRRINREAHAYADRRRIGHGPQSQIRFVKYRLKALESSATICEALQHHLLTELDLKSDMMGSFPVAQALKTVATERMVTSAHHYQQLVGGEGYRADSPTNIAGQAFLDSRVFTIFDGTNDLLSQQLTEWCLAHCAGRPLSAFLAEYQLTAPAIAAHRLDLRFLDAELRQEHLVLAGRVIAYVIAMTQVMRWAAEGDCETAARAMTALEFLKIDIRGVEGDFALLATGVLDDRGAAAAQAPESPAPSRAIPLPVRASTA
jgi:alkylation response protein AidB-like acyl-CoA dehydrogenase